MSLGRGTDFPFQVFGHPSYPDTAFAFTPTANRVSTFPKYVNERCFGVDLRRDPYLASHPRCMNLNWLRMALLKMRRDDFFDKNFNFHSGNAELQTQIGTRMSFEQIRQSWAADIEKFKSIRKKYLLYADFQ